MSYKSPIIVLNMFNTIADRYDFVNNLISLGLHKKIKEESVKKLHIKSQAKVLDLCCGTGDVARFIQKHNPDVKIIGIDFSENMLKIAQKKSDNIKYIKADCTDLPIENESIDLCTISFGLRNIENEEKAISEIYRVLKKDALFMHLDFGKGMKIVDILFNFMVPLLVKLFYKNNQPYKYLIQSKKEFMKPSEIIEKFTRKGFRFIKKDSFLFGMISAQTFLKD